MQQLRSLRQQRSRSLLLFLLKLKATFQFPVTKKVTSNRTLIERFPLESVSDVMSTNISRPTVMNVYIKLQKLKEQKNWSLPKVIRTHTENTCTIRFTLCRCLLYNISLMLFIFSLFLCLQYSLRQRKDSDVSSRLMICDNVGFND